MVMLEPTPKPSKRGGDPIVPVPVGHGSRRTNKEVKDKIRDLEIAAHYLRQHRSPLQADEKILEATALRWTLGLIPSL